MDLQDSGSDITVGFSYLPPREVETALRKAARGEATRSGIWPALLRCKVYVIDGELTLEDHGPSVELPLRRRGSRTVLFVYTSRAALPPGTRDAQVMSLPFPFVARAVPPWVSVIVDEGSDGELDLPPTELDRLRRRDPSRRVESAQIEPEHEIA